MFPVYLKLGFEHIADIQAYDHLLFLVALCAAYSYTEWKRILVLVTAFTVGHSITLALSALDILHFNEQLIEILIPITILLTALRNLIFKKKDEKIWNPSYLLPLFFGLIHGMGFSAYFKSLLGKEADIVLPLFAFNVGVEIGQVCIVAMIMLINLIVIRGIHLKQKNWNMAVSIAAAVLAGYMIIQRI